MLDSYVTYGDCISQNFYRSMGEDERGQVFSSLAVIHMARAVKTFLKLLPKSPHALAS